MSTLERAIEIANEALAAEGFSEEVIAALKCVTKLAENENYNDFIERVKRNPLAVAVQINDLTDNMDIRRLPYLSDKDVKRLKKYLKAYKKLIGGRYCRPFRYSNDPGFELVDIGKQARDLKKFLVLRDTHPAFVKVRERGNIGIPCFIKEGGTGC